MNNPWVQLAFVTGFELLLILMILLILMGVEALYVRHVIRKNWKPKIDLGGSHE